MMRGWRQKLEVYGSLGLVVYLVIYALTILTFAALLRFGALDGVEWAQARLGGSGATLFGGWVLAKVLQVPRIALTLAITPAVARGVARLRGQSWPPRAEAEASAADQGTP